MTTYNRSDWGARPPVKAPTPMTSADVDGIVLHWPGTSTPVVGVDACKRALRGWQAMHIDDRGWNDIAYQEAIDQQGNVYRLRGLGNRSGANGDADTNARFGALLLIVAEGEKPSDAMIAAVRARVAKHRLIYPGSRLIKGHGQVRAGGTQCPGKAVQALIDSGAFEPVQPESELSRTRAQLADWRKRLGTTRPRVRAAIDAFLKGTPNR